MCSWTKMVNPHSRNFIIIILRTVCGPLLHILVSLKGQCHEIFCFWFFSWISFPRAPEYSIKTVSIFFENTRRYSQLKVCHRCQRHRWQMEKIFNQKNFNNFVWSPLGSRGNIYINFCLQVHFQLSAAWYCSHYLPPVSMTPVANLLPVSLTPVVQLDLQISPRIFEKIEIILMLLSGAWGKLIHEKNQKQKSRDTVPLNRKDYYSFSTEHLHTASHK